jgi:hypothetical protein
MRYPSASLTAFQFNLIVEDDCELADNPVGSSRTAADANGTRQKPAISNMTSSDAKCTAPRYFLTLHTPSQTTLIPIIPINVY